MSTKIERDDKGNLILPEIAKMHEAKPKSQAIGEFIDWLAENNMVICNYHPDDIPEYWPTGIGVERLLADHFEIDLNKVDDEKRAILDDLRGRPQ